MFAKSKLGQMATITIKFSKTFRFHPQIYLSGDLKYFKISVERMVQH